jgi:hypothetical protein
MHDEPALLGLARFSAAQVISVIPSVAVKAVRDHRRAEQELYLAARHTDLDLGDRFVVEQIPLLYVDAVNATRRGRACGEKGSKNESS